MTSLAHQTGHAEGPENKNNPTTPQRIITIAPNAAEVISDLGAADRIVGVSKFCVYPPQLAKRPRVGGLFDPDLEKIIALRPDLLVLRGRCESVESLCAQRHIAVYIDKTDTITGIQKCITDLGRLLDKDKEARALASSFSKRLDRIRRRVADRKRPRVLLTVSRQPDRLANILTTGKGTFLHEMIEIAGGQNLFGNVEAPYPQVSPEAIVARRPDVVIELMPEADLTDAQRTRMLDQWKALGSIPAVTGSRVYFMTEDNVQIPSPRYAEIIDKVSRLLHPEPSGE